MSGYAQLNALRIAAIACKAEMETVKSLSDRQSILEKHLRPLSVKFGMKKVELQVEIYALTKGC